MDDFPTAEEHQPGTLRPPTCRLAGAPCQPGAHRIYAEARERSVLCLDEELGAWMVLGHAEVSWCFKQTHLLSNAHFRVVDPFVIGNDPPDHTRYRRAMASALGFMDPEAVRHFTRAWMRDFLRRSRSQGGFDAVENFGCPLPEAFIAHLLGLTPEESAELQALRMPDRTDLLSAQAGWTRVLEVVVSQVQRRMRPGFIGELLRLPPEERLEHDAVVGLCRLLWIAGSATTSHVLPSMVLLTLREPGLLRQLRRCPQLAVNMASETARLEGAVVLQRRSLQPFRLAGYLVPEGQSVVLCVLAANTDPSVFPDPLKVDLNRPPNRHLGFGGGAHYCLGAAMARMLMATAAEEFATQWPEMRAAVALDTLEYERSNMRALKRLPVLLA